MLWVKLLLVSLPPYHTLVLSDLSVLIGACLLPLLHGCSCMVLNKGGILPATCYLHCMLLINILDKLLKKLLLIHKKGCREPNIMLGNKCGMGGLKSLMNLDEVVN